MPAYQPKPQAPLVNAGHPAATHLRTAWLFDGRVVATVGRVRRVVATVGGGISRQSGLYGRASSYAAQSYHQTQGYSLATPWTMAASLTLAKSPLGGVRTVLSQITDNQYWLTAVSSVGAAPFRASINGTDYFLGRMVFGTANNVVMTYNGAQLKSWVNGHFAAAHNVTLSATSGDFVFGESPFSPFRSFEAATGVIHGVQLFDATLPDAQAASLSTDPWQVLRSDDDLPTLVAASLDTRPVDLFHSPIFHSSIFGRVA